VRYLLDTNIVSDLVRNPQGLAAQRVAFVGDLNVCTSIVVAAELRYGAIKKDAPRLTAQLEAVLGVMEVLPLTLPMDREYGRLRARLERDGQPIGGNDLLIAAQSVVLGLTLVTDNQREFSRIAELPCENWLR
jgi:tRNA(fMet)-specific endonuclease VapC